MKKHCVSVESKLEAMGKMFICLFYFIRKKKLGISEFLLKSNKKSKSYIQKYLIITEYL